MIFTEKDEKAFEYGLEIMARTSLLSSSIHLESFNHFLKHELIKYLMSDNTPFIQRTYKTPDGRTIDYCQWLNVEEIRYEPPTKKDRSGPLYISECLLTGETYSGKIFAIMTQYEGEFERQKDGTQIKLWEKERYAIRDQITGEKLYRELLGNFPIMKDSILCNNTIAPRPEDCKDDHSGYFVIVGKERVVVNTVTLHPMVPILSKAKGTRFDRLEFRSDNGQKTRNLSIMITNHKKIVIVLSLFRNINSKQVLIPLVVMMRALGIEKDKDIASLLGAIDDPEVMNLLILSLSDNIVFDGDESYAVNTQEDALRYLSSSACTSRRIKKPRKTQKKYDKTADPAKYNNIDNEDDDEDDNDDDDNDDEDDDDDQDDTDVEDDVEDDVPDDVEDDVEDDVADKDIDSVIDKDLDVLSAANKDKETQLEQTEILRVLNNDFLHIIDGLVEKGKFLAYLVKLLIEMHLGRREPSDRDSHVNKGLLSSGELFMLLVKEWWANLRKDVRKYFKQHTKDDEIYSSVSVLDVIKSLSSDKIFREAMNTGDWGGKRYWHGISQILKSLSTTDRLAHLNISNAQTSDNTDKSTERRFLHSSALGYKSPAETPESNKIGYVDSIAVTAERTIEYSNQTEFIKSILMNLSEYLPEGHKTEVQINVKKETFKYEVNWPLECLKIYLEDRGALDIAIDKNKLTFSGDDTLVRMVELMQKKRINSITPLNLMSFDQSKETRVFLNGVLIGCTKTPIEWKMYLKHLIWRGVIDYHTSVVYRARDDNLVILTSSNRLTRPLWRVENNKLCVDLEKLYKEVIEKNITSINQIMKLHPGIIEYIDPSELEYSMIATKVSDLDNARKKSEKKLTKKEMNDDKLFGKYVFINYTHCEIHQSFIFGRISNMNPFMNHNHGPRITYADAHQKQAICYALVDDILRRYDTELSMLWSGQRQLVTTTINHCMRSELKPNGHNVCVAILPYMGYNQEDSLIINKDVVKKGLLLSQHFRTERDQIRRNPNTSDSEKFEKPDQDNVVDMRPPDSYKHLNQDGTVNLWSKINKNQAIIGKKTPRNASVVNYNDERRFRDGSKFLKKFKEATVDRVEKIRYRDGNEAMLVRMYQFRKLTVGDKLSNRYGQKGCISIMLPHEEMPFTESGVTPDIILNPHAMPSRMTMGQILEMVTGKIAAHEGTIADATPFKPVNIEKLCQKLKENGLNETGSEVMYCGITGKKMQARIFTGPVYYEKLKHMVQDKIYSRAKGHVTTMTRQPVDGRSKGGGQRLGEMERDNLLSHGISHFLNERMMDCSDGFTTWVCDICGNFAVKQRDRDTYWCKPCSNKNQISNVRLPYIFKLFKQQMEAMNMQCKIETTESKF